MSVNLRNAEEDDLGAVTAIHGTRPNVPHWSLAQFKEELVSEYADFLVAEDSGRIIGYVIVRQLNKDAELRMIVVRPEAEGRGIGMQLLECALSVAKKRGADVFHLEVSAGNKAACGLYEKAGFHVVGRRAKYYNDKTDALLMDKQLG